MNPISLFITICSFHLILAIPENFDAVDPEDTYAKKIAADYSGFLFKRAPSGFFGMRGKKLSYDGIKRAPYGFTGMRGKKSDLFDEQEHPETILELYDLLIKVQNEINKMKQTNHVGDSVLYDTDSNSLEKRAPSGFMGMRGKKAFD